MLRDRLLSAIVLIPLVTLAVYAGGYWWFGIVSLAGAIAGIELFRLLRRGGYRPNALVGVAWVLLLIAGGLWPDVLPLDIVVGVGLILTLTLALFQIHARPATDWAWTAAGAIYLGALLSPFVALRMRPHGLAWIVWAVLTTWITDSGAYFIGSSMGRHRLAPRLSPKKTWEGAVGGWVTGVIGGAALGV
ncbi:MAG: phosphatidate cytidylyltransferase, partial [Anaerolineae bacterium]|nr:phosphatidate cytidylyltransferase [Anaerolineae bacterium]